MKENLVMLVGQKDKYLQIPLKQDLNDGIQFFK